MPKDILSIVVILVVIVVMLSEKLSITLTALIGALYDHLVQPGNLPEDMRRIAEEDGAPRAAYLPGRHGVEAVDIARQHGVGNDVAADVKHEQNDQHGYTEIY